MENTVEQVLTQAKNESVEFFTKELTSSTSKKEKDKLKLETLLLSHRAELHGLDTEAVENTSFITKVKKQIASVEKSLAILKASTYERHAIGMSHKAETRLENAEKHHNKIDGHFNALDLGSDIFKALHKKARKQVKYMLDTCKIDTLDLTQQGDFYKSGNVVFALSKKTEGKNKGNYTFQILESEK